MENKMTRKQNQYNDFPEFNSAEFHAKVAEGIQRAPTERAIAVKEFWLWFKRSVA